MFEIEDEPVKEHMLMNERNLWHAVLLQAIRDLYLHNKQCSPNNYNYDKNNSLALFKSNQGTWRESLNFICGAAGCDIQVIEGIVDRILSDDVKLSKRRNANATENFVFYHELQD